MQQASRVSRAARLAVAVLLAVGMCVPLYAYADEPAFGPTGESADSNRGTASEGPTTTPAPQDDSAVAPVAPSASASAESGSTGPGPMLASPAENDSQLTDAGGAQSDSVAAGVVTMRQGEGEAKGYDSIAAALADVADYDYKTNKEAYVISLNENVLENVVIPANKKVTVDLNGNDLSSSAGATLSVASKYATVTDGVGGGSVLGGMESAVKVDAKCSLTVSGGTVNAAAAQSAVVNAGTLTLTGGSIVSESAANAAVINTGTMTVSGGDVAGGHSAIDGSGKLTVKSGSVSNANADAGACAISVRDSGSLTVSGGEVSSPRSAVSAQDSASVAVSGGAVSGERYGVEALGSAKVTVSSGSLASSAGYALFMDYTSAATVSGGEFTSASGSKAIYRYPSATVTLSGGTFNVVSAADICDSPVFVDRYSAVEKGGKVVVEMTRPAATVITEDGAEVSYETFTKACSNAPAYSTVVLNEDAVLDKYVAEVKAFGVTVDLNGFSIDGTAYTGSKAALTLKTAYGDKPVEGKDSTLRLVNSKPATGGKVTAKLPVAGGSGDSSYAVPVSIGDEVTLETANGGATKVTLDSSAYLVYSEKAASYIANGSFKVSAADGTERIYGDYANAANWAVEGSTVVMLSDYTGNDYIASGDRVSSLDLGGHTYTYTGKQQMIQINYDDSGINLSNGAIVATNALENAGVTMLYDNGVFTMDGVTMTIPGDSWGIGSNGTNVGNTIVLKNSTLDVPEGLGIYFPSSGSVTIEDSVINAKHFGVQVCAGDLTVTGDKTAITATGTPETKTGGDGPIIDGAAVSVVEREGYLDLGSVKIQGGAFKSDASSKAVKTYAFNNVDKTEGEWPDAGNVVSVSGGTFSSPVDEGICIDGFGPQENADGTFGVHEHKFIVVHSDADFHWTECETCGDVTEKVAHDFSVAEFDAESHWMKCEGCDAVTEKAEHAFTIAQSDAENHWKKCEGCDATTEKAPHVSEKWESDAEGHWGVCSECGTAIGKTAHSFEWVVDKEATEAEPGSKHEECAVCGFAKDAVEIPVLGGDESDEGSEGDKGAGDSREDVLAQTGDATVALVGALGLAAVVSAALLLLVRRRTNG